MKKPYILLAMAFMLLFAFSANIYISLQGQQEKNFRSYLNKALQEKSKSNQHSEAEKKLENLLKGLEYIHIALYLKPTQIQAKQVKIELSLEAIQLALKLKNYALAQYLAKETQHPDAVFQNKLEAEVQLAKTQLLMKQRSRFDYWNQAIRDPKPGMAEEAILEISKMTEKEIFEKLIDILKESENYFLKSSERTTHMDEYYYLLIEALGAMQNPEAGPVLWNTLKTTAQHMLKSDQNLTASEMEYLFRLTQALLRCSGNEYAEKLQHLANQFQANNSFTKRLASLLKKKD